MCERALQFCQRYRGRQCRIVLGFFNSRSGKNLAGWYSAWRLACCFRNPRVDDSVFEVKELSFAEGLATSRSQY
jgi:hypothetical protein